MQKYVKGIAKTLLFVLLFTILYTGSRDVLRDKRESEALGVIVNQPNGTYDVILAGPSHMQYSIQPIQLFKEQGIAACNVSTSAQSIPSSYHIIKEMIHRHDPELVVLDVFCVFQTGNYLTPARMHQAIDNFPLSRNKAEAILDLVEEDQEEFFLNYLLYHNRWKELKRYDYRIHKEKNEKFQIITGGESFPDPFVPVKEKAEVPAVPLSYLKRLVDLCKETDTRLLLTVIPFRADVDNNNTSGILQQQMYNTVEELAAEWGVDFINGLHHLEEMNFDFMTDMYEDSHVNVSGSHKISRFYGAYIKEHYTVTDHTNDAAYADWHDVFDEYAALLKEEGVDVG